MSLLFAASSDRVVIGQGTPIDNLDNVTIIAWIYHISQVNGRLYQKGSTATTWRFCRSTTTAFGAFLGRATPSHCEAEVTYANLPAYGLNKWWCVAFDLHSAGANADQKISSGDLTTPMADASVYAVQTKGTGGAPGSDSGVDGVIGNHTSFNNNFPGRVAYLSLFSPRLTLAQKEAWRAWPYPVLDGVVAKAFYELGVDGVGAQPDLSGNGHPGSVTGATQVAHPDLIPFRPDVIPWWQREVIYLAQLRRLQRFRRTTGIQHLEPAIAPAIPAAPSPPIRRQQRRIRIFIRRRVA